MNKSKRGPKFRIDSENDQPAVQYARRVPAWVLAAINKKRKTDKTADLRALTQYARRLNREFEKENAGNSETH